MDDGDEYLFEKVKELIGEHFQDFCFCVITPDGDFYYDYNHWIVGDALMRRAIRDMNSEVVESVEEWEDGWDEVD